MRRLRGRTGNRRDEGAVTSIVAVLLAFGVILGMGAIVIDVGALMWERRQLQNGADAGALAVAQECAADLATCDTGTGPASTAGQFADQNSADAASNVDEVCVATGGTTCSAGAGRLPDCIDGLVPPDAKGFIQVRTSTRSASGSTRVPPLLANLLLGNESYDGATVGTCARAAWGPVASLRGVLPVTFSKCEWLSFTSGGTDFAPEPPYSSPPPPAVIAYERAIVLAQPDKGKNVCGAGPAGKDLPGGFGWIDHVSVDCTATIDAGGWVSADTGKDTPNACKDEVYASPGSVVWIPVYDCINGVKDCSVKSKPSGTQAWYHIWGFAAFYVTGFELSGKDDAPYNSAIACTGGERCLYGWFTRDIAPTAVIGPGPDTGLTAVQLVG